MAHSCFRLRCPASGISVSLLLARVSVSLCCLLDCIHASSEAYLGHSARSNAVKVGRGQEEQQREGRLGLVAQSRRRRDFCERALCCITVVSVPLDQSL